MKLAAGRVPYLLPTVALLVAGACTTLGPMPATTGISAAPIGRPGVDVQGGGVPGFYASQSVQNEAQGTPIRNLSALLDPDRWLPLKGLIVGARIYGEKGDTPGEPFVGYRRKLVDTVSVAAIGFGTASRAESQLASYHATRIGGEAAVDAEVWGPRDWLSVHVQGAASLTRILASGRYCVDVNNAAKDCDMMTPENNTFVTARTVDVYPSATATLAVEIGGRSGVFDRARLGLMGAVGRMPLVDNAGHAGTGTYMTLGLTLSVGLGLGRPSPSGNAD